MTLKLTIADCGYLYQRYKDQMRALGVSRGQVQLARENCLWNIFLAVMEVLGGFCSALSGRRLEMRITATIFHSF